MKIPRKYFQNPGIKFVIVSADGKYLYTGDNLLDGICTFHDQNSKEVYSFRPTNSGVFDFWTDSDEIIDITGP
jgi:6-phosphogluconolactonase (cycloisomerase 2 family)